MVLKLAILSILIFTSSSLSGCSKVAVSDQELIDRFQAKKVEFNQLAGMFKSDRELIQIDRAGVLDVDNDFNLAPKRKKIYLNLLSTLKLKRIERSRYSSDVNYYMLVDSAGLYDEGESKGYSYSEVRVPNLRTSLDYLDSKENVVYYRPIESNWLLYLSISR